MLRSLRAHRTVSLCFIVLAALAPAASQAAGVTVLHSFGAPPDGETPLGGLVQGPDGRLYGSTDGGGTNLEGTLYSVGTDGSFSLLHSFNGSDGNSPYGQLVKGANGLLYGLVPGSGNTMFSLAPPATFQSIPVQGPGGAGTLIDGGDGYFYGTGNSGTHGLGGIFRITPAGASTLLYSFDKSFGGSIDATGFTHGHDGNFYGALSETVGPNPSGALFRMTPDGTVTLFHQFNGTDGASPLGQLIEPGDGYFYGVTVVGGSDNLGTVFRIDPAGNLTTLHDFTDAVWPTGLALGPDGNLYGLTSAGGGGMHESGVIFRISTAGVYMTLHAMDKSEGAGLVGPPVFGSDGMLYGVAQGTGSATAPASSVFKFDALGPQQAEIQMAKVCLTANRTCGKPFNVTTNQDYIVEWSSQNTSACTASGAWTGSQALSGGLKTSQSQAGTYTYNLSCRGPSGTQRSKVTVTVGG